MDSTGASERHQNNNLKVILAYVNYLITESYIGKYNLFTSTKFASLLLSQLNYPIIIVRDYSIPFVNIVTHIMMKITGNLGPLYLARLMQNKKIKQS